MSNMKDWKYFISVAHFVLVYNIQWSISTKCGISQLTIIQNQSEYCMDCVDCPAGMGSFPQCGSFFTKNVTTACRACAKGVSYSESRDHTSCKTCRICDDNEEVIKECTPTSDAQCGDCKPGYYRSFVFSCEKCSPCCEDTKEEDIEPQCLRQGFASDRACRHTGRNCGSGLQPTSTSTINIELETTATQGLKKSKLPSSYLIGGTVLIIAFLLLLLLTMFLFYRLYFGGRRKERIEMVRLKEQYDNNDNVNMSSQVEIGTSLVAQTMI